MTRIEAKGLQGMLCEPNIILLFNSLIVKLWPTFAQHKLCEPNMILLFSAGAVKSWPGSGSPWIEGGNYDND